MTKHCDIGLIGLAVMGQNLILNMNDHGYTVAAYNRTTARTEEFLAGPAKGTQVVGTTTLEVPRENVRLLGADNGITVPFDPLVGTNNEGLFSDAASQGDCQRNALGECAAPQGER